LKRIVCRKSALVPAWIKKMSSCAVAVAQAQKNPGARSDGGAVMRILVAILALTCGPAAIALAQEGSEHIDVMQSKSKAVAFDEVHIQQETGRILNTPKAPLGPGSGTAKSAPEGSAVSTVPAGSISPNTCDPKNASSPACYTATQQSRGR
jgi:hypothetical protein